MYYIKKIALIILIFSSINVLFAQEDVNSYEYLKLDINNNIFFNIEKETNFKLNSFEVKSYFFTQNFNDVQYLNSFETNHENYNLINETGDINILYSFDSKSLKNTNEIKNKFIVESVVQRPEVTKKVKFPLKESEVDEYLQFEDLINIDYKIREQASILAAGEDDVYIIASKIAKWIHEDINYDLSTVTQNPNQKSTEVFESKAGVCKEITNLFISMMRGLGIPARVVTGYAYTNSEEVSTFVGSNWGGHAWAEVLIGDIWIPFDLTYNQYGFVDASHIIIDKSANIRQSSVQINGSGTGFKILEGSLGTSTDFKILDKKEAIFEDGFNVQVEGPDELGFGSYGYLKINIKNEDNFYKVLFLRLAKTKEIELLDLNEKMIIFEPNEERNIYFRYKIPDDLDKGFIYTFPFTIYNEFLNEEFKVRVSEDNLNIKKIALPEDEVEEKIYSNNKIEFDCNYILNSPENIILCSIKNINNYEINNLRICSTKVCQNIDLKINEEKSIDFNTNEFKETLSYFYSNEKGSFNLILDKPKLNFEYLKENDKLKFNYSIDNYKKGLEVKIYLNNSLIETYNDIEYNGNMPLKVGNNNLKIEMAFESLVLHNESFKVFVEKPTIERKTYGFFEKIWSFILSIFN